MFTRGPLLGLQAMVLVLCALLLMVFDQRTETLLPLKNVLNTVVFPIQYAVNWPVTLIDRMSVIFTNRIRLEADNERLRAEQLMLKAQVQKFLSLEAENSQLKALLKVAGREQARFVVAQLLAVESNPLVNEAVLDKGSQADIFQGQPVLDAKGIMGQIIAVGSLTSRIMFISDTRSAIPVQDTRSGVRAIAAGTGEGRYLRLINVAETANIHVGDVLVSSGLGQRFPMGYPLGIVSEVQHNSDELFPTILVKPFAELNRSRQVILVWPHHDVINNALSKAIPKFIPKKHVALR